MNRLLHLIKRRPWRPASFPAVPIAEPAIELETAARWLEDAKLFAGGWVAGLVLFGTLFS